MGTKAIEEASGRSVYKPTNQKLTSSTMSNDASNVKSCGGPEVTSGLTLLGHQPQPSASGSNIVLDLGLDLPQPSQRPKLKSSEEYIASLGEQVHK